ncbi:MAG: S41 family peptidase [Bacillota bacterium]
MTRRFKVLVLALVLALACLRPAAASGEVLLLQEVLDHLRYHHISGPDKGKLLDGALEGMFYALEDPYTEYYTDEEMKDYTDTLDGNYVGVGVQLMAGETCPLVVEVLPDSPAALAGIRPNDCVTAVGGRDLTGLSLDSVVRLIKGPEGTEVTLTLRRDGVKDFNVTVKRAPVHRSTVDYRLLDSGAGYFMVYSFGSRTAEELRQALLAALEQGMTSVVLDLRYNAGGYIDAAVDVASLFLDPGLVVTKVADREGVAETMLTRGGAVAKGLPVAVLTSGFTASAAEILAGALQDHQTAIVVGTPTYGKTTVQVVIPLKAGGVLKLTKYKYYTPEGRDIDKHGLSPDKSIQTPEAQLAAALRLLQPQRPQVVKFAAGSREVEVGEEKVFSAAAPFSDGGLLYVPLRFTLESMAYVVEYRAEENKIYIEGGEGLLVLNPGRSEFVAGNDVQKLGAPVVVKNGVTYINIGDLGPLGLEISREGDLVFLKG